MAVQPTATVVVAATVAPTDTLTAAVAAAAMAPEAMVVVEAATVALEATRCPTLVQA